ncbi:polyhomeotic-like protein 3 [Anopheles albimanus]|uniref:polyhomeotic-like protein 3 n=1 Tax=Anopheles albimanus TaxID=7167 RepID=UPI001642294A|nr:polyhomeotic-like protein 3 [Anopheles albimanus]
MSVTAPTSDKKDGSEPNGLEATSQQDLDASLFIMDDDESEKWVAVRNASAIQIPFPPPQTGLEGTSQQDLDASLFIMDDDESEKWVAVRNATAIQIPFPPPQTGLEGTSQQDLDASLFIMDDDDSEKWVAVRNATTIQSPLPQQIAINPGSSTPRRQEAQSSSPAPVFDKKDGSESTIQSPLPQQIAINPGSSASGRQDDQSNSQAQTSDENQPNPPISYHSTPIIAHTCTQPKCEFIIRAISSPVAPQQVRAWNVETMATDSAEPPIETPPMEPPLVPLKDVKHTDVREILPNIYHSTENIFESQQDLSANNVMETDSAEPPIETPPIEITPIEITPMEPPLVPYTLEDVQEDVPQQIAANPGSSASGRQEAQSNSPATTFNESRPRPKIASQAQKRPISDPSSASSTPDAKECHQSNKRRRCAFTVRTRSTPVAGVIMQRNHAKESNAKKLELSKECYASLALTLSAFILIIGAICSKMF